MTLDQFIYWSLTTKFTKPGEDKVQGWFARYYTDLAKLFGCKERTLYKQLAELEKAGLIERARKKFSTETRSLIRVTKKALSALGISTHWFDADVDEAGESGVISEEKCRSKPAENAGVYKEEINKSIDINNISDIVIHKNEKQKSKNWIEMPDSIKTIFERVGELLPKEIKEKIWACFCNMKKHNKIIVSNVGEYISWICFSIINYRHQLKKATSLLHALNIILRLAKLDKFTKPKGFNTQWELGKEFKRKSDSIEQTEKQSKARNQKNIERVGEGSDARYIVAKKKQELHQSSSKLFELKKEKVRLEHEMRTLRSDTNHLNSNLKMDVEAKEQLIAINNAKIANFETELAAVYEKMTMIELEHDHAKEQEYETLYDVA